MTGRIDNGHLPAVVQFEGIGPCYYVLDTMRFPRRGEYYLSGAIIEAWRAPNDLSMSFRVVRPTFHAVKTPDGWIVGSPVLLPKA